MKQKDITLELLVRAGNPVGVKEFADSEKLNKKVRKDKVAEAGIYSALNLMWEQADGGIDSRQICPFLSQKPFAEYLSETKNTELLEEMIDALQAGTNASMETYAQITAVDFLGIKPLAGAIRRNIDAHRMKEKVTNLVERGYSLVFCPHDIDADMVDHYFPILKEWKDFVNPQKVAREAIEGFEEEGEGLLDEDYRKKFVYKALDKLVELTNRKIVTNLVHAEFEDSPVCKRIVKDGKIDEYLPPKEVSPDKSSISYSLSSALRKYENTNYPSESDAENLADNVRSGEDRKYMGEKVAMWFAGGRMRHFFEAVKYKGSTIYDVEIAKKIIGRDIARYNYVGTGAGLNKLKLALELPENLVDESNPAIIGFVSAYKIHSKTKKEN